MSDYPGLVSKEIIHSDDRLVVYRETGDLKVAGCPYIPVRFYPFRVDAAAVTLVREYFVGKEP